MSDDDFVNVYCQVQGYCCNQFFLRNFAQKTMKNSEFMHDSIFGWLKFQNFANGTL